MPLQSPTDNFNFSRFRYVSDHAYNGYKWLCQKKLLNCARIDYQLARQYPPCLLEWRGNRKRIGMALEASFTDGKSLQNTIDPRNCDKFSTFNYTNFYRYVDFSVKAFAKPLDVLKFCLQCA